MTVADEEVSLETREIRHLRSPLMGAVSGSAPSDYSRFTGAPNHFLTHFESMHLKPSGHFLSFGPSPHSAQAAVIDGLLSSDTAHPTARKHKSKHTRS